MITLITNLIGSPLSFINYFKSFHYFTKCSLFIPRKAVVMKRRTHPLSNKMIKKSMILIMEPQFSAISKHFSNYRPVSMRCPFCMQHINS